LQASQARVEADTQIAELSSSLKQIQSQAAALSHDKERLTAQLQQQQQALKPTGQGTSEVSTAEL